MTKNMLTYLSHQFCINCCVDKKKFDCDTRSITCDKLASFLVGCHKFQKPIDEEELDDLATYINPYPNTMRKGDKWEIWQEAFKAGYRKAMEE